jgi:hypothetical protein
MFCHVLICLLGMGVFFIFDILTALGYAVGIYYIILSLYWEHFVNRDRLIFTGAVVVVLSIGFLLSPTGHEPAAIHNRLIAVVVDSE